jgi:acetyltransferase
MLHEEYMMPGAQFNSWDANQNVDVTAREYPSWCISDFIAADGTHFIVRPIRVEDEPLLVDFHRQLSEPTVYRRYFSPLPLDARTSHDRLLKRCLIDYHNEMALVAIYKDERNQERLAAVARLIKLPRTNHAEVAFVVADQHQGHGLGSYLLQRIIEIAVKEGLEMLEAVMLPDNFSMKDLFRRAGFQLQSPSAGEITASLKLRSSNES